MTVFAIVTLPLAAAAEASGFNPFFGDKQNQVHFMLGQGFDSGELILAKYINRPVPYYLASFTYSQPNSFFRMPGRQSMSFIKTIGFGRESYFGHCPYDCEWGDYSAEIFMLSQDFAIQPFDWKKTYFGAGLGVAVQGKYNDRLNTKFLIPFRMFAGHRINDSWNVEFVMQHFSNGDTGDRNGVYNFYALGVAYNF